MLGANDAISQRIESLADEIEPTSENAAARLRELGAAVNGGHQSDVWAGSDIFQLVNPDMIAEQIRNHGLKDDSIRVLELLRNALVFAPIAVTWMGIWHALESYTTAIEADPNLSTFSFLYLWQQGFGGRSLTLSTIALVDGTLLILVFVFTLIVLWHNNQRDIESQQVRDELVSVLTDASLVLEHKRMQQKVNSSQMFERMVNTFLSDLGQERAKYQELLARKEHEVSDLAIFSHNLLSSSEAMADASQALYHIPQQLSGSLAQTTTSLEQLALQQRDQQKEFVQAMQKAAAQLKEMTEAQEVMSRDMQAMGTSLQAMGTNLSLLIQNLAGQQQDFISTSSQVSTQFQHLTEAQKTIGVNLQTMLINMQTMSVDLRSTVDTMKRAANETARTASEIGSLMPSLMRLQQHLLEHPSYAAGQGSPLSDEAREWEEGRPPEGKPPDHETTGA